MESSNEARQRLAGRTCETKRIRSHAITAAKHQSVRGPDRDGIDELVRKQHRQRIA